MSTVHTYKKHIGNIVACAVLMPYHFVSGQTGNYTTSRSKGSTIAGIVIGILPLFIIGVLTIILVIQNCWERYKDYKYRQTLRQNIPVNVVSPNSADPKVKS